MTTRAPRALLRSALGGNPSPPGTALGRFTGITGSGTTQIVGETNDSDVLLRYRVG